MPVTEKVREGIEKNYYQIPSRGKERRFRGIEKIFEKK